MKRTSSDKVREKRMDSLRDLAIFAIEPPQGKIEIANSYKTDTEVRLAAKHLIEKLRLAA